MKSLSEKVRFGLVWRKMGKDEGVDVWELFVKIKYDDYFWIGRLLNKEYFSMLYDEKLYEDIILDEEDDEIYKFDGYEKCNDEGIVDWIKNGCK